MSIITISNNGDRLKITNGTSIRNVLKAQILDITVIKSTIIKLDLGKGPLDNIFLDSLSVSSPQASTPDGLVDLITAMITPGEQTGGGTSDATKANQQIQINQMNALTSMMSAVENLSKSIDDKLFFQPLRIDDSGAEVSYRGYAVPSSLDEQPVWAIERSQKIGEVDVFTWANGNKGFNNVWTNRELINYA